MLSDGKEFIPSELIGEVNYVLNLIALIIAIIFCVFLFQVI